MCESSLTTQRIIFQRKIKIMSSNITTYADYVSRGRQVKVSGKVHQRKVGAVVVVVDGSVLRVGWSLCNGKEGDRFNPEIAMSLAEGRARLQHTNSLRFGKNQVPTTLDMIRKGVPQSCLSTMSNLITKALNDHKTIHSINVFNTKTEKQTSTPQLMW